LLIIHIIRCRGRHQITDISEIRKTRNEDIQILGSEDYPVVSVGLAWLVGYWMDE
jgi:hypothetical protein